jgi:hypothetical protein
VVELGRDALAGTPVARLSIMDRARFHAAGGGHEQSENRANNSSDVPGH